MRIEDILQRGVGVNIAYQSGRTETLHVRAIVDEDYVVVRQWSARKGWMYRVVDRYYFELLLEKGSVASVRRRLIPKTE